MVDTSKVYFNGINALTGEYGIPPLEYDQIASIVRGETQEEGLKNWIRKKHQFITQGSLGELAFGKRHENLEDAGWAIVFHKDEDEAVKKALEPLIEHRRQEIKKLIQHRKPESNNDEIIKQVDKIVKHLEYLPNEQFANWLVRHHVTGSAITPEKVPYYLLLIGSPEKIPFLFGHLLDAEYAVGRLHFDTVDGYKAYVSSLIEYETRSSLSNTKEVTFFAPRHNFDQSTQQSADNLVDPLADNTVSGGWPNVADFGFSSRKYRKNEATKERLREILTSEQLPAILFTASHGLEFPATANDEEKQRQVKEQGALVCQNWPGFGSIKPEHYFSAADIPTDVGFQGMIAFHFACFGGGTPSNNRFLKFEQEFIGTATATLADRSFFAALPKALLQGGALACIAHVERAWGCSFVHPQVGVQLEHFANALARILSGQPIGHAMDSFSRRYINLSAMLTSKLEDLLNNPVSDEELALNWLERNDAESYVIIGDPAVRLRIDLLQQPNQINN